MASKIIRSGLRIPMDLNTELILKAQSKGISKNALLLDILWEWLEKEEIRTTKAVSLDLSNAAIRK